MPLANARWQMHAPAPWTDHRMILVYLLLLLACLALVISALVGRARSWRPPIEPGRPESIAAWSALVAALAVSGFLLFFPLVASRSTPFASDGDTQAVAQRVTLLESGELAILPVLAAVVVLAATPVLLRRRRARYWVEVWGALVLAALSLLSGFSIGTFLLPIASLMFAAALLGRVSDRTA